VEVGNRRGFKGLCGRYISFTNPLRIYHIVHLAIAPTGVAAARMRCGFLRGDIHIQRDLPMIKQSFAAFVMGATALTSTAAFAQDWREQVPVFRIGLVGG
jgi:hypothetical protein